MESYGPGKYSLTDFMSAAPAEDWTYEGRDGGGDYVLSWTGESAKLQAGVSHTVRFHVHGRDASGWVYGSAWIEGEDGVSINVNHLKYGQSRIKAIVDSFKSEIAADMEKAAKDSKGKK